MPLSFFASVLLPDVKMGVIWDRFQWDGKVRFDKDLLNKQQNGKHSSDVHCLRKKGKMRSVVPRTSRWKNIYKEMKLNVLYWEKLIFTLDIFSERNCCCYWNCSNLRMRQFVLGLLRIPQHLLRCRTWLISLGNHIATVCGLNWSELFVMPTVGFSHTLSRKRSSVQMH